VPDVYVGEPGLSVLDPALSFVSIIQGYGAESPYFVPPSNNVLMLRPAQLMSSWPSSTKFRAGDYGSPIAWEEQQIRGAGDWWMHSSGPVTPLALSYTFPANTGWFIEFQAYSLPKSVPGPIFDLLFGQNFQLFVGSDGRIDLFDLRRGLSQPIGSGSIASRSSFANQTVSLMVLPFRRNHILIWSPDHGGYLDAAIDIDSQGIITEPCAPVMYSSITPPSALVAITPLLYTGDGVAKIDAPAKGLLRPLSMTPSVTGSVYDRPPGTSLELVVETPYMTGENVTSLVYSVTMQGNIPHQSAESQGIIGISGATASTSGDSVITGTDIYPQSVATPFLYLTSLSYPRSLELKSNSMITLTGILDARLQMSKDRLAKSLTFVVDNPANVTGLGTNYTGLKDLQNRRCRAYLTNPTLEAGGSESEIGADPDPDTPLIIEYGYQRITIFDGFTDQPEFVDGVASRLSFRCQGLRKRLINYVFIDQPFYDGMTVNDVVTNVLERAGFVGTDDAELVGLPVEIVTQSSTSTLPSAVPGDEPLFTPAVGSNAEDFLQLLMNLTGFVLDDLIGVGATGSVWYWTLPNYYAESVYLAQGSPTINREATFVDELTVSGSPLPDATRANRGLGSLSMLARPVPKQSLEELVANDIYVVGCDDNGQMIIANARDEGSISNEAAGNYIGEPRSYLYVSQTINTQESANYVCASLFASLSQARTRLTFVLPDYYPQLGISAPLSLSGYWDGAVESVEAELGELNVRRTLIGVLKGPA
jgi:hypothetical protein